MSYESDQRYAKMDEKKRKRMLSNRESARRSRMKKQNLMLDLTSEMGKLQIENNGIVGKINGIGEKYMIYASKNNVLRAQLKELAERLKSLNDFIKNCEVSMDADKMFDEMPKSWQIPLSSMQTMPIHTSHP